MSSRVALALQKWARFPFAAVRTRDFAAQESRSSSFVRVNRFGVHLFCPLDGFDTGHGFLYRPWTSCTISHDDCLTPHGRNHLRQQGANWPSLDQASEYLTEYRKQNEDPRLRVPLGRIRVRVDDSRVPSLGLVLTSRLLVNGLRFPCQSLKATDIVAELELPAPAVYFVPTFSSRCELRFQHKDEEPLETYCSRNLATHTVCSHFLEHSPGGADTRSGEEDELFLASGETQTVSFTLCSAQREVQEMGILPSRYQGYVFNKIPFEYSTTCVDRRKRGRNPVLPDHWIEVDTTPWSRSHPEWPRSLRCSPLEIAKKMNERAERFAQGEKTAMFGAFVHLS